MWVIISVAFAYIQCGISSNFGLQTNNESNNDTDINQEISQSLECSTENGAGKVFGDFVHLSHVIDPACFGEDIVSLQILKIYALHSVIIDVNLTRPGMSLIIIAPLWIIEQNSVLDLSGLPGKSYWAGMATNTGSPHSLSLSDFGRHNCPNAATKCTFTHPYEFSKDLGNCVGPNRNGPNGTSGGHGGNAGHFFGLGFKFPPQNPDEYFTIKANGGDGGFGQDGGDATDWTRQITAYRDVDGGNGGNGGDGGNGGSEGSIAVFSLTELDSRSMEIVAESFTGIPGGGGVGGEAAERGNYFCTLPCWNTRTLWDYEGEKAACRGSVSYVLVGGKKGNDGENGKTGTIASQAKPNNYAQYLSEFNLLALQTLISQRNNEKAQAMNLEQLPAFLDTLATSATALSFVDLTALIDDYSLLEVEYFYNNMNETLLLPFFHSYVHKVNNLLQIITENEEENARATMGIEFDPDTRRVFQLLYIAAYSHITAIDTRSLGQSTLVMDVTRYLLLLQENLNHFQRRRGSLSALAAVQNATNVYLSEIQNKFAEASNFIENFVAPEIERIENQFKLHLETLAAEVDAMRTQQKIHIGKLEEAKETMERRAAISGMFSVLKLGTQVLSFMGPKGQAIGGAVGGVTNLVENAVLGGSGGSSYLNAPSLQIPSSVHQHPFVIRLTRDTMDELYNFSARINTAFTFFNQTEIEPTETNDSTADSCSTLETNCSNIAAVQDKIEEVKIKLDQLLEGKREPERSESGLERPGIRRRRQSCPKQSPEEAEELSLASKAFIRNKKKEIQQVMDTELNKMREKIKKDEALLADRQFISDMQNIQAAANILNSGVSIVRQFQQNERNSEQAQSRISAERETLRRLEEHQVRIEEKFKPLLLADLKQNLGTGSDFQRHMHKSSSVGLTVGGMCVKNLLGDIKVTIRKEFTEGFASADFFQRAVERLEEGLTAMIEIYEKLQTYEEQSRLAKFISNVNTAPLLISDGDSALLLNGIQDSGLRQKVMKLQILIQSNIILSQYEKGLKAFKMWIFPFAHLYLGKFKLPRELQSNLMTSREQNLSSLVETAGNQISSLRQNKLEYDASVKGFDDFIHNSEFVFSAQSQPFCIWKGNGRDIDPISKLLSGEKVVLRSDIEQSPAALQAVKFSTIRVDFFSWNKSTEMELAEKLSRYQISLRHLGNSQYRFNGSVYLISTEPIRWVYTFSTRPGSQTGSTPVSFNQVYGKVAKGDLMLSPYAMWEIQITPTHMRSPEQEGQVQTAEELHQQMAEELSPYAEFIELHLTGRGSYVSFDGYTGTIPDLHVPEYYVQNTLF